MQLLAVAALFDGVHHDVLGRHEGQLGHHALLDDLRIDDEPVADVEQQLQMASTAKNARSRRRAGWPSRRACAQTTGRRGKRRVDAVGDDVAPERADALAAHGIALIGMADDPICCFSNGSSSP